MKLKKTLLSAIVLGSAFVATAQSDIKYEEFDLDNGLHVILHEDKSTPIAAVTLMYHVGSKNEKVGRTGFAHFFEHLMFEGTTNIDRHTYDKFVEGAGGTLNANTSQDRTFYFEILPSNQLELGLWLESERMLHAKVNNKGIETQRSVVKEEKRQRVDNQPYASFITEMFLRSFPNHPYNWVPIGSMEHLDAAQEEDYVNFYKTFYVPSNATLSIAGDLDIEQTKKWIDKYFASMPKGQAINLYRDYLAYDNTTFQTKYGVEKNVFDEDLFFESTDKKAIAKINEFSNIPTLVKRTQKDSEPIDGIIKDVVYDNIQLPALFMGYKFPEQTNADSYALEMMNQVLSGGSSSRINKAVVEKKQMATFAFSFNYALEDSGLGIFAAIASKDVELDDIQGEFDMQIDKIKNELISDEEFQKIRTSIETNIVGMNSTVAGIAENLANNHVYFGSAEMTNTFLNKYLSVTKEDIQRVAQKYLTQDRRVILHYLPKEEK